MKLHEVLAFAVCMMFGEILIFPVKAMVDEVLTSGENFEL